MNIRHALVTAAVQLVAANTNLIRKEEPLELLVNTFLGDRETNQERIIRETEEVLDKTFAVAKRIKNNREFKKIVKTF